MVDPIKDSNSGPDKDQNSPHPDLNSNINSRLIPDRAMLNRFFRGEVENAFAVRLGYIYEPVISYISGLLCEFIKMDNINNIRTTRGQRLQSVTDMMLEAQARQGEARAVVHKHIGDVILFWQGFYPEVAEHIRKTTKDYMIDYIQQGRRNYWIASETRMNNVDPEVLRGLSQQFDLCCYGLGEVRKSIETEGKLDLPLILG